MRRFLVRAIAVLGVITTLGAGILPATSGANVARTAGPTRTQIARAVRTATHSRYLWATVNVCTHRHGGGGVIGIRGQMPALGFPATLSMSVALERYDASTKRYIAVPGATARHTVTLDSMRAGVHQDGAEFPYTTTGGLLEGTITFTWTRAGHQIATATRTTSAPHPAAFSVPTGYSSASCRL